MSRADNQTNPKIPRHVAIVMDGNGRWAKKRHLPRIAGHKEGLNAVRRTAELAAKAGIEVLTLFAFSSENWRRPPDEVSGLMGLFLSALQNEVKKLHENNIQLRIVGDKQRFGSPLQASMEAAEQLTQQNTGLKLIIAADYGGRWDIVQAVKTIAQQVQAGKVIPDEITEQTITNALCLSDLPEPDLFIRTSGEQRISNFMIWQLAYTELYFTDNFWPDFDAKELTNALTYYADRERRFGHTAEQLENITNA